MAEEWLSEQAHRRLRTELEELKTDGRQRMAKILEEARSHGDIRENAEYDAAKNEQARMEARIRQLEELLRDVRVGEPPRTDTVAPGVLVTIEVDGDEETYLVGSREDRHGQHEVLSSSSPLGQALLGRHPGDVVVAEAPNGSYEVQVKRIEQP